MMYIMVRWLHNLKDEPVMLYSELDSAGREVRKVEVFRDGSCGYADAGEQRGSTRLGIVPVPDIAEIAKNPEFEPKLITKDEFEQVWQRRQDGRN